MAAALAAHVRCGARLVSRGEADADSADASGGPSSGALAWPCPASPFGIGNMTSRPRRTSSVTPSAPSSLSRVDHLLHQDLRRRCAGGDADAPLARDPLGPQARRRGRPCRRGCRDAPPLRAGGSSWSCSGCRPRSRRRPRAPSPSPRPGGSASRSRCRRASARRSRETRLQRRDDRRGIVHRQRGLRHVGELRGSRTRSRATSSTDSTR